MKSNQLLMVTLLLFGSVILPLKASGQGDRSESFVNPKMSLTVTLEKPNYVQWEPVTIKARFENKTDTSLVTLVPYMLMDSTIVLETESGKREFNNLTVYRSQIARQPTTFKPGQIYEHEFTLESSLDELFPKPGAYVIQFVLNNSNEKRLVSNPVAITIDNVTGIDKEALDFIDRNKVNQYYPMLFSWGLSAKSKDGKTLLEDFVEKYSSSVYGDFAVLQLGNYYFANQQFEKAKNEFNKVKSSPNIKIKKDAQIRLTCIP